MKKAILFLSASLAISPFTMAQNNMQDKDNDSARMTAAPNVSTTDKSATISWNTNSNAATIVKFGTDANNLAQVKKQAGGARDHQVTLSGLQPGTTYFFAIMTNDGDVRQRGQFTTKGTASANATMNQDKDRDRDRDNDQAMNSTNGTDNIAITMGPEIRSFNGSTATLYWETDKVAANEVVYGNSPSNLNLKAYEPGGSRQHSIQLSNLQPGQTVYFEILRRNGSIREPGSFTLPGSVNSSANGNFAAIPVRMSNGQMVYNNGQYNNGQYGYGQNNNAAIQITTGPMVQSVSDTQAVVTWVTNVPASSTVRYGQSWLALNQQAQAPWGPSHTVIISGLKPNTKYFFRVESAQAENTGTQARSQFGTFQTGAPGQSAQAPR